MSKTIISTTGAPAAIGPYVQAVKVGNMVYTSGCIPLDPVTMDVVGDDVTTQARQVMENLMAVLAEAGASASSVVKTTCFLDDMSDFLHFNEVYASYFSDDAPARSCVEVSKLPKGVLVEVEAIALCE